jgi:hypothetical protein
MMGQAIEQRRGQLLVAEDLDPFAKSQVSGDDSGPPFVALREQVEEQLAPGAFGWHEAQFVDDQQGDLLVALLQTGEGAFVTRFKQALHQIRGPREKDPIAPASGFHAQADHEHWFCRCRSAPR